MSADSRTVFIDGINHRGVEFMHREVLPIRIFWGQHSLHGEGAHWMLEAYVFDRNEVRYFDMSKITKWEDA